MKLAQMAERASVNPLVRRAALQITSDCDSRDDMCELKAIYQAVKNGDPRVAGLGQGVRYVSDSLFADQFYGPAALLEECANGACAGDCDDHCALICALCASIGFKVGARAYGPKNSKAYSHVYAVVFTPKREPAKAIGMDTTVPYANVGWQPPRGRVMTAIIS